MRLGWEEVIFGDLADESEEIEVTDSYIKHDDVLAPLDTLLNRYEKPVGKSRIPKTTAPGEAKTEDKAVEVVQVPDVEDDEFIIHTVAPGDTLGGLELRYGISWFAIRRANGMTNDRLTSHLTVKIPKQEPKRQCTKLKPTKSTDKKTERLQIIRIFEVQFPGISEKEIDYYLKTGNGDLKTSLIQCSNEFDWERANRKQLKKKSKVKKKSARPWYSSFLLKSNNKNRASPSGYVHHVLLETDDDSMQTSLIR